MNEVLFQEDWQTVKYLAARLAAIGSLLQALEPQFFVNEFHPLKLQLQTEFARTFNWLIELIDVEDF